MAASEKDETDRIRKEMTGGMEMSAPSWIFQFSIFPTGKNKAPDSEAVQENHHKKKP